MSMLRKSYKQCNNRDDEDELFEVHNEFLTRSSLRDRCKVCTDHVALVAGVLLVLAAQAIAAIVVILYLPEILASRLSDANSKLNPVAQTSCGAFVGVEEGGAYAFKGIPYARPPVGELRWKRPQPLWSNRSWCNSKSHFQATSFGSACFQLNPFRKQFEGQEDCLYLNVWTPTLDPEASLEVMVWFHGGFLQFGSGHQEGLSPSGGLSRLMNVVFVSFNSRLHVLGYLALDSLFSSLLNDARGNYGAWDQLLVMQWVRDNVLYFGGDPGKVTVFGADGGGASILAMMSSSHFRGLFRGAWLLGPAMVFNRSFSEAAHYNRQHFGEKSGCAEEPACLRKMTPREVTKTYIWNDDPSFRIRDQNDLPIQGILPEQLLIVDGDILPSSPVEAILHRSITDIPLLIGTSAQAVDFWPGPEDLHSWSWNQYRKYVTTSLDSFTPRVSQQALQLYNTSNAYEYEPTPELLYTTMVTDIRQTCPINDFTEVVSSMTDSPVWRYVVTTRPSKEVHVYNYPGIYSIHLWEAIAFFDQMHRYIEHVTDEDVQFRTTLQKTVLEFVKSGGSRVTTSGEDWLRYPNSIALLDGNITLATSYQKTKCKFWAAHGLTDYSWVS